MLQRARALLLFFLKVNIERNVRAYLYNWECVCGGGGGGTLGTRILLLVYCELFMFSCSVHVSYHMQARKHTSRESEIESEG